MTDATNINTLHQLLDEDARRFSTAEAQLQHALPIWIIKADSIKLKNILQRYFDLVKLHIKNLDKFFEEQNMYFLDNQHTIMKAFIEDAEDRMNNCKDATVRDACILASVQLINHYKISAYGTAAAFANTIGLSKSAVLFHECEVNEKQIDDRLSQLAEHEINKHALTTSGMD
jgi:ferritin-like metal-binding protein YciE